MTTPTTRRCQVCHILSDRTAKLIRGDRLFWLCPACYPKKDKPRLHNPPSDLLIKTLRPIKCNDRLLAALTHYPGGSRVPHLAAATSMSEEDASNRLQNLVKCGYCTRISLGVYQLTQRGLERAWKNPWACAGKREDTLSQSRA